MRDFRWVLVGWLLVLPNFARAEEEDAVRVYKQLRPSVVSLQNLEGSGTGVLLNTDGLILTNAHVIASPLPFKVKIDTGNNTEATFTKVQVMGYHPRLDLALVKIDPKEQHVTLSPATISQTKADPGQRIFVIGNPGAGGMILTRTITSGMISGVDRVVDGEKYYQTDAAINPGNSGGPVCDKAGKVLGIVTFKFTDAQATGFAIPLFDVNLKAFVPITARKTDPEKAHELEKLADKYAAMADRIGRSGGMDSDERKMLNAYAAICYRLALVQDPANPALYYNVGMLLRTIDENETAAGYLVRALELEPWDKSEGNPYRELGLSLAKQKRDVDALTSWREGLAKSPYAAKIWEDMAIYHANHQEYAEAVTTAATTLLIAAKDTRVSVLEKLLAESRQHLSGEAAKSADQKSRPAAIVAVLDKMLAESNAARKQRKLYITPAFAALMKTMGGAPVVGVEKNISQEPIARLKELARYSGESTVATGGPSTGGGGGATTGGGWIGGDTPKTKPPTGKTPTAGADDGGWVGGGAAGGGAAGKPQVTGRNLGLAQRGVNDAMVTPMEPKDVLDVIWSADGKFAFILQKDGMLRKMAVANLTEERQINIASPCTALGRAKPGIVVAASGLQEVWVLDDDLNVKKRIKAANVKFMAASPALTFAYASSGQSTVTVLDLVNGTATEIKPDHFEQQRGSNRPLLVGFNMLNITPDGRYLFSMGGIEQLLRFRITGRDLIYDAASPRIAQNGQCIVVSPDSSYVALPSGGGNYGSETIQSPGYATYVFKVGDLKTPATIIESGAYPRALGFDPAARSIYAQNYEKSLIVFSGSGLKGNEYKITDRGDETHRFIVHPAGKKLFVLGKTLYWVELSQDAQK